MPSLENKLAALELTLNTAKQRAQQPQPRDALEFALLHAFEPDRWQQRVLYSTQKRIAFNCSRQSGKSTIVALLAAYEALHKPNSLTILVSPSLRQSGELFKKARDYIKDTPLLEDNRTSLEVDGGGRIVSLPGSEKTTRGYSAPGLIAIDECARVEQSLIESLSPMLSVGNGRLVLLSTPWGRNNFFADGVLGPPEGWQVETVKAKDVPRIPPAFLEEEKASLPRHVFKQEYECEFEDSLGAAFAFDEINEAIDPNERPLKL